MMRGFYLFRTASTLLELATREQAKNALSGVLCWSSTTSKGVATLHNYVILNTRSVLPDDGSDGYNFLSACV
jgi:hypothetical protein